MSARPHLGLALLTSRRALGGWLAALLVPLALLAARARWAPADEELTQLIESGPAGSVAHALTLAGVWSALLVVAAPWLVLRAAAVVPRWRSGEVDWLASAPRTTLSLALSAAAGLGLALALVVVGAAAVAGLAARGAGGPGSAPELRLGRALSMPAAVLDGTAPLRLELEAGPRASEVRVRLFPVAGGAGATGGGAARVRLTVTRAASDTGSGAGAGSYPDALAWAEVRVAGRTELRAPLPPGSGPCTLELARLGEGPLVALAAGSAEALEPVRSPLAADLALAGRALATLASWCALALGLGAWIGRPLAALLTLSLALLGLTSGGALPVAGTGLVRALALAGEGVVPPAVGAGELARAGLGIALGLALARAGLASWRRA